MALNSFKCSLTIWHQWTLEG